MFGVTRVVKALKLSVRRSSSLAQSGKNLISLARVTKKLVQAVAAMKIIKLLKELDANKAYSTVE